MARSRRRELTGRWPLQGIWSCPVDLPGWRTSASVLSIIIPAPGTSARRACLCSLVVCLVLLRESGWETGMNPPPLSPHRAALASLSFWVVLATGHFLAFESSQHALRPRRLAVGTGSYSFPPDTLGHHGSLLFSPCPVPCCPGGLSKCLITLLFCFRL